MCMLRNSKKMAYFTQYVQCVLLILVLAGNSTRFRILSSYMLLLKSSVLMCSWREWWWGEREKRREITERNGKVMFSVLNLFWSILGSQHFWFWGYGWKWLATSTSVSNIVPSSLFLCVQYSYFSFLLDFRGCRSAKGQFGITWASTRFGETNTQLCPTGEGKKFGRGPHHIVLVASWPMS